MSQTAIDAPRRPYRMRARRAAMRAMADRIAAATFELHREIGPAKATISAIAERAGVQRHTVYRHYPDLVSLFRACTAHGMREIAPPDPRTWEAISDPYERLATALTDTYRYFAANEQLVTNLLRDAPLIPEFWDGAEQWVDYLARVHATVTEPWDDLAGESADKVRALIGTALAFETWQSLARRGGLSNEAAAQTMTAAVRAVDVAAGA